MANITEAPPLVDVARELNIEITAHFSVRWRGSRTALEAEGLIPANATWPTSRTNPTTWAADEYRFVLSREKPSGDQIGDIWSLSRTRRGQGAYLRALMFEHYAEISRLQFMMTPAGLAHANRCVEARLDKEFQGFMVAAGCAKPRRARRSKVGA